MSEDDSQSVLANNGKEEALEKTRHLVEIPEEFYRKIESKIAGSRFSSVDDYVVHVMKEVIAAEEGADDLLTEGQRAKIENRLRDLGYFE